VLRAAARLGACLALVFGALMTSTGPAAADPPPPGGGVWECHNDVICVGVEHPGSPGATPTGGSGSTGGGGGAQTCRWYGQEVPCSLPDAGWFNSADGCYYKEMSPQPAAGDPAWEGRDPAEGGKVYTRMCRSPDGDTLTGLPPVWLAGPPAGPPPPTPAELAERAVRELAFTRPVLHTAPGPDGRPLVGLPLWLWYDRTPGTYGDGGQLRSKASAGGTTVTATATFRYVEWTMGDGTTERCDGPGTPYEARFGSAASPDCGHRYARSSADRPDRRFTVTATLHWRIEAVVDGTGVQPIEPIPDYTTGDGLLLLPVGEVQVLN
jgi:hypothetical protein